MLRNTWPIAEIISSQMVFREFYNYPTRRKRVVWHFTICPSSQTDLIIQFVLIEFTIAP